MADAEVVSPKARVRLLPRSKTAMYLFTLVRHSEMGPVDRRCKRVFSSTMRKFMSGTTVCRLGAFI